MLAWSAGELFCFAKCIFKGRPARNRVVFINLSGARRREGKAPENRASLTWHYSRVLPAASSHEGRTTPSRCLPLMKTTRFLAGTPPIFVRIREVEERGTNHPTPLSQDGT